MKDASSCPECGASQRHGSCREQLRRTLLRHIPEGDLSHALAVACFTLQHPAAQSEDTLRWAKFHLEGCLAPPSDRAEQRTRALFRMESISNPVTRARPTVPISVVWHLTVADLATLSGGPAERAHAWARTTLEDLYAA